MSEIKNNSSESKISQEINPEYKKRVPDDFKVLQSIISFILPDSKKAIPTSVEKLMDAPFVFAWGLDKERLHSIVVESLGLLSIEYKGDEWIYVQIGWNEFFTQEERADPNWLKNNPF